MTRVRSPNYPQLSLPDAIDRVARIFAKEHRHRAPRDVVAQHLGYKGINGASAGVISALIKYGLLDQEGETLNVTDRAISILHPGSEGEKRQSLQDAARSPSLFSELLEQFAGQLPSDENLRSYLIRRGFSQSSLSGVIEVLRDTMTMIGEGGASLEVIAAPATVQMGGQPAQVRVAVPSQEPQETQRPMRKMSVTLEDEQLRVSAVLSDQNEINRLIQILTANKLLLPEATPVAETKSDNATE